MSRKSRQPDSGGKGRKGKKGKKKSETTVREVVVEDTGPPFGLVVLIALAMTLPTLTAFFDGSLEFRPMVVRLLAALLVSWLLCQLVWSVVNSFSKNSEIETALRTEMRDDDGYGDHDGGSLGEDRQAS